jgi:hypothetical protein
VGSHSEFVYEVLEYVDGTNGWGFSSNFNADIKNGFNPDLILGLSELANGL